jgi:hypothetical protein
MPSPLLRLALTGSLTGCLVAVAGCHWVLWMHDEDELAYCDWDYEDCMENAVSEEDEEWCEDLVEACYEACEAGWEDDEADDADEADEADERGEDQGDTDGIPPACFDLHANCIEQAQSLADIEACEALFEQCSNPGPCPGCGCPELELEACLSEYAECTATATTEIEVDACAAQFDACIHPFADSCEIGENPNLEACLAQHQLCVACADGDEQIAACKAVFDSCMIQQ